MNRFLLISYIILLCWCIGAFGWIGKEMVEQHKLFDGVKTLRQTSSEEAEKAILSVPADSPLYIVQELQQETHRDVKMRVANALEKAIGRNPKELDLGNVFTYFTNEKKTLRAMLDGQVDIEMDWLNANLRERLLKFLETSQPVMTTDQQNEILKSVNAAVAEVFADSPARERADIHDHVANFVKTRWADLSKERENRIVEFVSSFIHLSFGRASREDKDRLVQLLDRHIRSAGADLTKSEREWLAENLSLFLKRQVEKPEWRKTVDNVARAYALDGWVPLVDEEKRILKQVKKLRSAYSDQRIRFARLLLSSIEQVTGQGQSIDRVLLKELVSILNDPNDQVTNYVSDSLQIIAEIRMKKLALEASFFITEIDEIEARGGPNSQELIAAAKEQLNFIYNPIKDEILLLHKTLYREGIPGVMAVPTRQKTKSERKEELERMLRSSRVKCANAIGRIGLASIKIANTISDSKARKRYRELVVDYCRRSLTGILGSPNAAVVDAAQLAVMKMDQADKRGKSPS